MSLSFYDSNGFQIPINSPKNKIDLFIPREPRLNNSDFQFVNVTNITVKSGNQFLTNGFYINTINASIHIQLKPLDISLAYLIAIKFGNNPYYNATHSNIDSWTILCPQGNLKIYIHKLIPKLSH